MTNRIDSKIVGYKVVKDEDKKPEAQERAVVQQVADIVHMHESVERPDLLLGSTYKIKTPLSDHALYVTINDMVLNEGTEHERRQPFEVFINSKNMDHFQWVVALTRVISAVFRKGGDVTFLVEELKAVFDPQGGYFKKGGRFMPSLVAEIGDAIESHMKMIGLLKDDELDEHQKKMIEAKLAEYEEKHGAVKSNSGSPAFPERASLCKKCHTKAAVMMDGCLTCLNCGDSKCG